MIRLFSNKIKILRKSISLGFSTDVKIEEEQSKDIRKKSDEKNLRIDQMLEIPEIIDLDAKKYFKGNLIICPTPIGNLKDLSVRAYEALTVADVIACEDTRIAGKLFKLLRNKNFDKIIDEMTTKEEEDEDDTLLLFKPKKEDNTEVAHPNQIDIKRTKKKLSEIRQVNDVIATKKIAEDKLDSVDTLAFLKKYNKQADNDENEDEDYNDMYGEKKKRTTYFIKDDFVYDTSTKNVKKMNKTIYGLEDTFINHIREKVYESKLKKKRGLLISCHKFNEKERLSDLIKLLKSGLKMVLISDAGSPCISDPGQLLINEAIKHSILIESIPGPSAISIALSASGFPANNFAFIGYLPKNIPEMKTNLRNLKAKGETVVIFESKHRINATLLAIQEIYGMNQFVYVGVELTKLHERNLRGVISKVYDTIAQNPDYTLPSLKGELTIIIAPYTKAFNVDYEAPEINMGELGAAYNITAEHIIKTLDEYIEISSKDMAVLLSKLVDLKKQKAMNLINYYKKEENNQKNM